MKKMIAVLMFMLMVISSKFAFAADSEFNERLEPLCGIEVNSDSLSFVAAQKGYTKIESFRIDVAKNGDNQELRIFRILKDEGKMMPQREKFTVSVSKINLDTNKDMIVVNPIIGNEMLMDVVKKSDIKKDEKGKNQVSAGTAAATLETTVHHGNPVHVLNNDKNVNDNNK